MRFTENIKLISKSFSQDDVGNVTATETERDILAKLNNVSVKEFYSAVEVGITPSMEFLIRSSNYQGEDEIIYGGLHYHVIRTIRKSITDMVLVVEKKAGGN